MKRIVLTLIASVFSSQLAFAQPAPKSLPAAAPSAPSTSDKLEPLKFDLDFPGGTPQQLVDTIVKQSGRPLNAIIPDEFADTKLPALKMREITVPALFDALLMASLKTVKYVTGTYSAGTGQTTEQYQQKRTSFGFSRSKGEDAVWYFSREGVDEPTPERDVCRFYQLGPDLEKYKIEDITTAIKTGWQLLNIKSPPTLKFHSETKLLIAVGHAGDLQTIDSVLQELRLLPPQKKQDAKKDGEPVKK
ncbi:MAG: hypothetical protein ABI042_14405 [Verrucomicrobiota bacterium]